MMVFRPPSELVSVVAKFESLREEDLFISPRLSSPDALRPDWRGGGADMVCLSIINENLKLDFLRHKVGGDLKIQA